MKKSKIEKENLEIKKKRIFICGSFHGNNFGDVAILYALMTELKRKNCELSILSKDSKKLIQVLGGEFFDKKIEFVKATNPFSILSAIKNSDHVIVGGGGLIFDHGLFDAFIPFWGSQLHVWIFISIWSKIFFRKVYWLGVGAGPISFFGGIMARFGMYFVDNIQVRDKDSLELLSKKLGNNRVQKSADFVFLSKKIEDVEKEHKKRSQKFDKEIFEIAVILKKGIDLNNLEKINSKDFENIGFTFLSTNPKLDNEINKKASEILSSRNINSRFLDTSGFNFEEFVGSLKNSDLLFSTRMHGLLLAFQEGILGVGIGKTQKVKRMQEDLYNENLNIFEFDFSELKRKVDYIIKNQKELRLNSIKNYSKFEKLAEDNLKVLPV